MAKDKNEYDVFKGLLDGSQAHTLSKEILISCVQERTLSDLQGCTDLHVLHDFCDIRKANSVSSEYLGKVQSLEKTTINGYKTFNSVVVDTQKQAVHLLNNVVFSNRMPHFVCQEVVKIVEANAKKGKEKHPDIYAHYRHNFKHRFILFQSTIAHQLYLAFRQELRFCLLLQTLSLYHIVYTKQTK